MRIFFSIIRPPATIAIALLLLSSCGAQTGSSDTNASGERRYSVQFTAMDSPISITAYGKNAEKAVADAKALVTEMDSKTDVHDSDSEIGRLNVQGTLKDVSPGVRELLARGKDLSEQTDGTFNITIRPVSAMWNIGQDGARIPPPEELSAALAKVDYNNIIISKAGTTGTADITGTAITLKNGAAVDLGGIAKGYAADKIAALFREMEIKNALIGLSGNIYALGKNDDGEDWQIGLQDPEHETPYIGVLFVSDTSVVTSGSYERYSDIGGVRYGHIFNQKTGYPVENDLLSVTIISKDSTLADAYSTALFVMGADKALRFQEEHSGQFDAVLVTTDKRVICTDGIKNSFELADKTGRYTLETA